MGVFARLLRRRAPETRFVAAQAPSQPEAVHREPVLPPRLIRPGDAFTPTQPKTGHRRLVGRQAELRRVMEALQEDRAHVVLYAERGRGKTSLSNLVIESLRRDGVIVGRHTCEAGSTFDSILQGLMRDLPGSLLAGAEAEGEGCESALPPPPLRPRDVVGLPGRLTCRSLVCVVDEFDRIQDVETKIRFADTIKQLSDTDAALLFLIVGVSDDLDQILGQHPSIQRNVTGIHLPLFSDSDVAEIIVKGARESGLIFPPPLVARIVLLARGMPTMAQLLGLRLAQAAGARDAPVLSDLDFETAVERMIGDASPRVLSAYATLTDHGRDDAMVRALQRVATGRQDAWGRLRVVPDTRVAPVGAFLLGDHRVPAACWERLLLGGVVQPSLPGSGLFTFADRSLMQHVLLLMTRGPELCAATHAEPVVAARARTGLHAALRRG